MMRKSSLLEDPERLREAYSTSTIAEIARSAAVSPSTVQRALKRHGIDALPRNRNRRPKTASVLDDAVWLTEAYESYSVPAIAEQLGVSARTVYAAMDRHGLARQTLHLRTGRPQLDDAVWLAESMKRASSTGVGADLGVSASTVRNALVRHGMIPSSTLALYDRGRRGERPTSKALWSAWETEESARGVGRRFGVSHTTAQVWLAEIGVFVSDRPAIAKRALQSAIYQGLPIQGIALRHGVSTTTVRIEFHRHQLYSRHRQRGPRAL